MKAAFAFIAPLILMTSPCLAQGDERARELAEIEQRLKDRAAEQSRLKDEATEREKEVAALRHRMIETANSLQEAERRIDEISRDLEKLGAERGDLQSTLSNQQKNLSDVLAALISLERSRPPALLVSPNDAGKAARAAMLLSDAAPALEARAAELRTSLDRLAVVEAQMDRERARFQKTNDEISARRTVLSELLSQKQSERDVAARLAAAAQSETAALASRAKSLRELIRRLERLATSITPRLKPAPRKSSAPQISAPAPRVRASAEPFKPATSFTAAKGALRTPAVGRLIGRYGKPNPDGGLFEGVRIKTGDKAIVTAPFEANVLFAQFWALTGNMIVLDVGGDYHVVLMGVGAFLVEEGQSVAAGEPVGVMNKENTLLDLEIRKNYEPVNPELWLSGKTIGEIAY